MGVGLAFIARFQSPLSVIGMRIGATMSCTLNELTLNELLR
jgi:hypothetical protein